MSLPLYPFPISKNLQLQDTLGVCADGAPRFSLQSLRPTGTQRISATIAHAAPKPHHPFHNQFLKFIAVITLAMLFFLPSAKAQQQRITKPGEILLAMQKLKVVGSVLYIAAHPDDENTRLLAYLANEKKLRTGYLSLTRGDGGQNLIGTEQGDALGLLRTQELLAARRTDGAEQFFTRANDFGYSKSPEETFSIWNKNLVLADVVWTIRRFRPDVIITRFPTTGEGGHGHHTASAILASEAFLEAGDPTKFPEQLKYVSVWQPRRLFWNTFKFGSINTTAENQIKIDVGGFNPLLGEGYGEMAAESRSNHKSQGFGTAKTRGEQTEYFKLIKGDSMAGSLFAGIVQDWSRFPGTQKLAADINQAVSDFKAAQPAHSLPELLNIYKDLNTLKATEPGLRNYQDLKLNEVKNILVAAAGMWLEADASKYFGVPGQSVEIKAEAIAQTTKDAVLAGIEFPMNQDSTMNLPMQQEHFYTFSHTMNIPKDASYSDPYWLRKPHPVANYIVSNQRLIGQPENEDGPSVSFKIKMQEQSFDIQRKVVYKSVDPVRAEVYRPFEILPPVTIELSDKVIVSNDAAPRKLLLRITAYADNQKGKLIVTAPEGWQVSLAQSEINIAKAGDEADIAVSITSSASAKNGDLHASVMMDGKNYHKSIHRISYDHVPYQFFLQDADAKLVRVDLKKRGNNIGYIPGAGDEVPASLQQIGYKVTMLTDDMLANADLSKYDAIVAGIRAYNVNEKLPLYKDRLMKYVEDGGNYIVQYNTNSRLGPLTAKLGPWPFSVTSKRVTDENATVTFLNPKAPVLNEPNKITQADFKDWIQERGTYFAGDIDPRYEKVFSMHDIHEAPEEGSLIIGKYGKGNFVYAGIVFFRELPAGVPGAYRLFANLLSLPKN
ncbi:MAG: PIG-L family deacetylase [Chitinophagaceae bacterium]